MEKIRLGKTGMMVSRIGFGGIPIQRDTEEEAVAVVRRCLELGITYLDTANGYTTSEKSIGKAIAGLKTKPMISTKTHSRDREGIERHLKLSLERLGVEAIDLYQFHGVSDAKNLERVLAPNGALAVVEEARKKGLVKHIGITSHSMDIAKEAVKTGKFETIMFPFNFIASEAADELLPLTRKHDVGLIAMKPLAGGMIDNVSIAFKYLLQFPDVVPIVGIEKVHEIDEIVPVVTGSRKMTKAEEKEMQHIRETVGTRFCHRCNYCQPCTSGIDIATVMSIHSHAKRMPGESVFAGMNADRMEKVLECADCGDCEERCPYHLPIREMIKEQYDWYKVEQKKYRDKLAAK